MSFYEAMRQPHVQRFLLESRIRSAIEQFVARELAKGRISEADLACPAILREYCKDTHILHEPGETTAAMASESGGPVCPLSEPALAEDQRDERHGMMATEASTCAPAKLLPRPYCRAITRDGERVMDKAQYDELVGHRREWDMFIDGIAGEASARLDGSEPYLSSLSSREVGLLVDVIRAGGPVRPKNTETGRACLSPESACRLFESARHKVDVRLSRYEWRAFRVNRNTIDSKLKTYEFVPPEDLRYCVIVSA